MSLDKIISRYEEAGFDSYREINIYEGCVVITELTTGNKFISITDRNAYKSVEFI